MPKLIDVEEAIKAVRSVICDHLDLVDDDYKSPITEKERLLLKLNKEITKKINKLPTADARENVRAHWLKEEYFCGIFKCSNCGKYVDFRGLKGTQDPANFCPNCGKYMRERREDEVEGDKGCRCTLT